MRMIASRTRRGTALEQRLAAEWPDMQIVWLDAEGHPESPADDATIFFRSEIPRSALATALQAVPALRWLHSGSAGMDGVLPAVRKHGPPGLIVTNSSGAMARPIAEYCLAQMLIAGRSLHLFARGQIEHQWLSRRPDRPLPPAREALGARVLILGLGSIGGELARLASAIGMRVWGTRRRPPEPGESMAGIEQIFGERDDWRSVLPEMDFVVSCLPLTDETRGTLGAAEFARMAPTAWVVNISRGDIFDEDALIAALRAGQIGGAVLDVMHQEPLPPDSPLWDFPNVILTPHISWRSTAVDARALDIFFDNLRRFRTGEPLRNVVSIERGY
jgi:phosphoglycerate dehydrogenase-like enzyme